MSAMPKLKNLQFDSYDVGQNIKATKKLYKWTFYMNEKLQIVELFQSKVSGKRKAVHNGNFLYEDMSYNVDFSFSFYIEQVFCNLIQIDSDRFELRIMNRAFSMLMEEERNRRDDDEEVENKKPSFMAKSQSTSDSPSKFDFPKFLKSSNKKSVSHVYEEKTHNFTAENNQNKQNNPSHFKNVNSVNLPTNNNFQKNDIFSQVEVTTNNNNNRTSNMINMDDILNSASPQVNQFAPQTKKSPDIFSQIDFISGNSSVNSGNLVNVNNNFQVNNNFGQGNSSIKSGNQFNPFADFDNITNVSPNKVNNNVQFNSGLQPQKLNFDNFNSGNIYKVQSGNNNLNFTNNLNNNEIYTNNYQQNTINQQNNGRSNSSSKTVSTSESENELKKKLLASNKLVNLDNLFGKNYIKAIDDKKPKVQEKPQNNPVYAFTGTPLNLIQVETKSPQINSGFNSSGNSNNQNMYNNVFNSGGNQGFNVNQQPNYVNNMNYPYQMNSGYMAGNQGYINNMNYGNGPYQNNVNKR